MGLRFRPRSVHRLQVIRPKPGIIIDYKMYAPPCDRYVGPGWTSSTHGLWWGTSHLIIDPEIGPRSCPKKSKSGPLWAVLPWPMSTLGLIYFFLTFSLIGYRVVLKILKSSGSKHRLRSLDKVWLARVESLFPKCSTFTWDGIFPIIF